MSKMNKITRDTSILFRKLNVNIRKRAERVESLAPRDEGWGDVWSGGKGLSLILILSLLVPFT